MGPKRLVLTLAIRRYVLYFVQLRIAKVKTSLLGPIDSTYRNTMRDFCWTPKKAARYAGLRRGKSEGDEVWTRGFLMWKNRVSFCFFVEKDR